MIPEVFDVHCCNMAQFTHVLHLEQVHEYLEYLIQLCMYGEGQATPVGWKTKQATLQLRHKESKKNIGAEKRKTDKGEKKQQKENSIWRQRIVK